MAFTSSQERRTVTVRTPDIVIVFSLDDGGLRALQRTDGPNLIGYGNPRPSIDVLFECVADEYGGKAIGVILTGANNDGARGLAKIGSRGGVTVVENPETAACHEMPRAALAHTKADWVLPLEEIAPCLNKMVSAVAAAYGS